MGGAISPELVSSTRVVVENPAAERVAWFCLRSQRKSEHIAAANLAKIPDIEVVNPQIRFRRSTSRGPAWVTEAMFPSYLFARFNWNRKLDTVRHTFGVAAVVHFGMFWPIVPDGVVDELRTLIGEEGIRTIEQTVEVGEEIEVATGSFEGFRGIVARVMPAKDRVAVLLDFLGRQTSVELPISGIIRSNNEPWAQLR
jgi:transcriptional antiterminator RfaH